VIGYGFVASVLPVWMLLCPRDYLSTFMKIGTILLLALGILLVLPPLRMPAVTRFVDGTGPIFAGKLFPFAFITIACGRSAASTPWWPRAPRPRCWSGRATPGSSATGEC
jgi:carbon starvation protein